MVAYTMYKIKPFVAGCGGGTDGIVLLNDGEHFAIRRWENAKIEHFLADSESRNLAIDALDPSLPAERFEENLELTFLALKRLRVDSQDILKELAWYDVPRDWQQEAMEAALQGP